MATDPKRAEGKDVQQAGIKMENQCFLLIAPRFPLQSSTGFVLFSGSMWFSDPLTHCKHACCIPMLRQRGSLGRGSRGGDAPQRNLSVNATDGYDGKISMPVRLLIDNWEARLVSQQLALGRDGGQVNYYWLVKNMLGILMKDVMKNWDAAKDTVLATRENFIELDNKLGDLETDFAWKNYTMGQSSRGAAGGRHGTGKDEEAGVDSAASLVSSPPSGPKAEEFPIPSATGPMLSKRVWREDEADATPQCKTDPLPVKLPPQDCSGNFTGRCPILEEVPEVPNAVKDE